MDKKLLEQYLKLLGVDNDVDAVMGLRGLQSLFVSAGTSMESALRYAADHLDQYAQKTVASTDRQAAVASSAPAGVNMSGVPECRISRPGTIEIVLSGKTSGDVYSLQGEAAKQAEVVAAHLKDAIVVAVVNKSRFKLKLVDIKNSNSEGIETVLQAEYERPGMTPVRIWVNSRGEVGALAALLRKAMSSSLPDLVAG
jgi:hypothetical protein